MSVEDIDAAFVVKDERAEARIYLLRRRTGPEVGEADLINARHSGRIVYKINPRFARHKVDNGPVMRRERLDAFSTVVVRFSERVLCVFFREQVARLGKTNPSPLARRQCRQRAGKCGVGCSVGPRGIGRSGSVCPK